MLFLKILTSSPGRYSWELLLGVCRLVHQKRNITRLHETERNSLHYETVYSLHYETVYITRLHETEIMSSFFLKIHFELHITLSFVFVWN